jgi:hypothetical protein
MYYLLKHLTNYKNKNTRHENPYVKTPVYSIYCSTDKTLSHWCSYLPKALYSIDRKPTLNWGLETYASKFPVIASATTIPKLLDQVPELLL